MRMRDSDSAGFTLIELMVTLTLMGLALAVAGPALVPPASQTSAVRDLVRALESARSEAARTGEQVEVWIDMRSGSYRSVRGGAGAGWFGRGRPVSFDGSASGFEDGRWRRIVFDPTGRTTGGSFSVLIGSAEPVTISLDRWSGRVHVSTQH